MLDQPEADFAHQLNEPHTPSAQARGLHLAALAIGDRPDLGAIDEALDDRQRLFHRRQPVRKRARGGTHEPAGGKPKTEGYPSLAQIAGHAMSSIFLDGLAVDVERLSRQISNVLDAAQLAGILMGMPEVDPDRVGDIAVLDEASGTLFASVGSGT